MNKLVIKEFTLSEHDSAVALWKRTEGVCNCDKCMHFDSKEQLGKYFARNPGMSFVAIENNTVVGTILAGHDGRTGLIYRLTVAQELQRKGIGKQLVDKSVEALKQEGMKNIKIFVLNDNEGGNSFWGNAGFTDFTIASTRNKEI